MASRVFIAAYHGRCADCSEDIEPGDEARYNDDDEVVGEDCCGWAYEED